MSKHLHSVFCDDIRLEVGNKLSFMGSYFGTLIVPSFPFDLPRLSALIRVGFDEDEPPSGPYRIVLLLNDQEIAGTDIGAEDDDATVKPVLEVEGATDLRYCRHAQVLFALPQLHFEAPAVLRPRAIFENEVVRGDGLLITTPQAQ